MTNNTIIPIRVITLKLNANSQVENTETLSVYLTIICQRQSEYR